MDAEDGNIRVPAWAEVARRQAAAPQVPPQRAAADPYRWLDEPWRDLARNLAGYELLREAAKRRRSGESDDLSWRVGADGEDVVATALRALTHPRRPSWPFRRSAPPTPWLVLHNVKLGRAAVADIDHVLIGPPGIVVINTKQLNPAFRVSIRGGEIYSGRYATGYLRKSSREAQQASWLVSSALEALAARMTHGELPDTWDLSAYVRGVESLIDRRRERRNAAGWLPVIRAVVFVGRESVEEQPSPVLVTRSSMLCRRLVERPSALRESQVHALYEIARRSTTWTRNVPRV